MSHDEDIEKAKRVLGRAGYMVAKALPALMEPTASERLMGAMWEFQRFVEHSSRCSQGCWVNGTAIEGPRAGTSCRHGGRMLADWRRSMDSILGLA